MAGEIVFLSYAAVDRTRIEVLVKALEGQGLDVWWDRDIPRGKSFNRVIEEALQRAKCVIVIWSRASVASEWVFNEASDARKREIMVPVLIDEVEPPLEFRHLQAAHLVDWRGEPTDREWEGLLEAVRSLLQQPDQSRPAHPRPTPQQPHKPWLQTPAGLAMGAGGLLIGAAALLIAFKQVGWVGGAGPTAPAPASSAAALPAAVAPTQSLADAAASAGSVARPQAATGRSDTAPPGGHINLLDPQEGGKLVIANQEGWRQVMERDLRTAVLSTHGFAVFAFRDEKPAQIDTVAVYVETSSGYNVKELAVYAADESETGPFRKVATVTVPNYRNMRAPLHQFKVDPFAARYVKLELVSWQDPGGLPNGYVGNVQLFGTLK